VSGIHAIMLLHRDLIAYLDLLTGALFLTSSGVIATLRTRMLMRQSRLKLTALALKRVTDSDWKLDELSCVMRRAMNVRDDV